LITYSIFKNKPKVRGTKRRRRPEYDANIESVRKLVAEFEGRIVYLYAGASDQENLERLMKLNLMVLLHVGGYCYRNIWRLLLMCRVAALYIEYLASAFLLLSDKLAHFTITSLALLSNVQRYHQCRERIIALPWLYGTQRFYMTDVPSAADPDPTPVLVYMAGLGRLNDLAMMHYGMDIIHRCADAGVRLLLRLQTNPDTMYSELKREAAAYCASKGWPDLSNNIEAEPHFHNKIEHLRRASKLTRMIFLAVGSVNPHTGTVDADLMDSPSVTLPDDEWPGRVTMLNNIQLGLGPVLNATNEEDFIQKVVRLVRDTSFYDSIKQHLRMNRERGTAPYADGVMIEKAVELAVEAFVGAGGDRTKLKDIDLTNNYELLGLAKPEPFPELDDVLRIRSLGLNSGMRVNKIMAEMESISGRKYLWGEHGATVELLLECLGPILSFVRLLGCGASRFTLLAVVRTPQTEERRRYLEREIGWYEGQELAFKLLHTVNGELPTIACGHNDPNLREVKALLKASRLNSQNLRVSKSMPRPMSIFPSRGNVSASAGYIKCRKGPECNIITFMAVQYVGETWHGSRRSSEITSAWRNDGVIDESMRLYARSLLFCVHRLHEHFGIAAMDISRSNIFECEVVSEWLLDPHVKSLMRKPALIGLCDLGSCHEIGTAGQRASGDVGRSGTQPKVLSRKATNEVVTNPNALKRPILSRPNKDGIVFLNNADIQTIFERRRGSGLGRTTTGTPGSRCEIVRGMLGEQRRSADLKPGDCMLVDRGAASTMLFGQLRPRQSGEELSAYNDMRLAAAKSPAAMQSALKSSLMPGVAVKQPDTVANVSNLLYCLLRHELNLRISTLDALCHPFVSLPVLPPDIYQATRDGGYLFPGGLGPAGSPWAETEFPAWNLKHVSGKGLGAFAVDRIAFSKETPVALYCAFDLQKCNNEDISEWPPGRSNVSMSSDSSELAIGELPMAILRERRSPGVYFNAGSSGHMGTNNLRLERKKAWRDGKGLIYIPMYTLKTTGLEKEEEGLWKYPYTNGQGAKFSFDDSKFDIRT
jgi:hypothetical protein